MNVDFLGLDTDPHNPQKCNSFFKSQNLLYFKNNNFWSNILQQQQITEKLGKTLHF